ncbi:unnamed protein product [Cuscuta campestris]|uniref:LIM zinc-binding domain-containing protein n=1 Tax=Cuscuta campestris TaxID=132261 RepID=A0A484LFF7_9ASTE|nr:unnamed protein product [Cuscuta campestris]
MMEGESYHRSCFKCAHGGCPLTHATYAALDGVLYCKHHFAQLFMEKGNYQHVLKAATHKRNPSASDNGDDEAAVDDSHSAASAGDDNRDKDAGNEE